MIQAHLAQQALGLESERQHFPSSLKVQIFRFMNGVNLVPSIARYLWSGFFLFVLLFLESHGREIDHNEKSVQYFRTLANTHNIREAGVSNHITIAFNYHSYSPG